ncbi:dnaJ subfamily B member 14 [Histomonas meleagridis]|uniref:dnaJ-like subfamily B member 14 n=1 Tax=Histomonas meleagridis TaxID=135588 RepID=UPI0035594551|nr:dnaJ subfamily B member 14 [Histomonas meleagridis]KAH0798782.1 dnaJ-like subfamily B member 14 [Histomonas meleagridis]
MCAEQQEECERILRARTHYEVLQLEKTCTTEEVRRSYKRIALKVHPDRNKHPKATEAFQKISIAYETLSKQDKRAQYDRFGDAKPEIPQPNPYNGFHYNAFRRNDPFFTFSDDITPEELFQMFTNMGFGNHHTYQRRQHRQQNQRHNELLMALLFAVPSILMILFSFFTKNSLFGHSNIDKQIRFRDLDSYDEYSYREFRSKKYELRFAVPKEYLRRVRLNQSLLDELRARADTLYIERLQKMCRNEQKLNDKRQRSCDELLKYL